MTFKKSGYCGRKGLEYSSSHYYYPKRTLSNVLTPTSSHSFGNLYGTQYKKSKNARWLLMTFHHANNKFQLFRKLGFGRKWTKARKRCFKIFRRYRALKRVSKPEQLIIMILWFFWNRYQSIALYTTLLITRSVKSKRFPFKKNAQNIETRLIVAI